MAPSGGFIRELHLDSVDKVLKIFQRNEGDVSCVVWDAGIVLAEYLDCQNQNSAFLCDRRAIDLGSGTGIVGLTAAALGANVILSDLPGVCSLLEMNAASNSNLFDNQPEVMSFDWNNSSDHHHIYQYIFLSDCVYYPESVYPLLITLKNLSDETTEIFMSYEDRESSGELVADFIEVMSAGFEASEIPLESQHPEFRSSDIHVWRFRNKKEDFSAAERVMEDKNIYEMPL